VANTWKEYQEEAASFFRGLGLDAQTDVTVQGVRTSHDIDVLVKSHHVGFDVTWLIECKHWQTRVSKLHVLALREIVTDIGADRGILLSENGFQSGAIEAATLTNVHATSLAEVRKSASKEIISMRLRELYDRIEACRDRYWDIAKEDRIDYGLRPEVGGLGYSATHVIELVCDLLSKALRGTLPIKSETVAAFITPGFERQFNTAEELVSAIEPMIGDLEARLRAYETKGGGAPS
jgi:restriction system protein